MIEIRYASPDGLFQVSLASEQVAQMLAYCQAAKSNETGGILVGYYTATRDCAIITAISGPTKDSRSSRTRFKRGTQGLGRWLVSLWNEPQRSYYLGEWHFHPYAAPIPSGDDSRQMRDIAASPDYHCPEPLLMILGGNPLDKWQLSAHVFVRNAVAQELQQQKTSFLDVSPIKQEKVIMPDPITDSQNLTQSTEKKTKKQRPKSNPVSLVSPGAMGGIIGGGGYDFQKRYITCRIVKWLVDPEFRELLHEGLGDADVLFNDGQADWREHIQIKDHEVAIPELREVLEKFLEFHREKPGLYKRYTLACLSLVPELKRLNRALDRLRGVGKSFYGSEPDALEPTKTTIRKHITEGLHLDGYADFIISMLDFDADLHNFHDDGNACATFIGYLALQQAYMAQFQQIAQPAYAMLLREVEGRRGKTFGRTEIEALLSKASVQSPSMPQRPVLNLTVHNWALGKYDTAPDHELDWCEYFDRRVRRVPSPELWSETLLPQIATIESAALKDTGAGIVRFRGACCLTTGIAVGNIFREVGGWTIEMYQSQTGAFWRSDATPVEGYTISIQERAMDSDGDSIAVLMNIKGDGVQDVEDYLQESGIKVKVLVTMEPHISPGSLSIQSDGEAVAFANQARDTLQRIRKQYRTRSAHLFFFGPQALAVFLGHRLTSVGQVHLYEFQDPSYTPSCILKT